MKLNSTQVKQTLSQFDAEVLSDSHPAVPQLNDLFGDHTFFLDGSGLLDSGGTLDDDPDGCVEHSYTDHDSG